MERVSLLALRDKRPSPDGPSMIPRLHTRINPARMLALALTVLGLAGCGSSDQPGSPEVYAKIEAMTDCVELQATFDRNMDDAERREPGTFLRDVVLSYADTADSRMRDIGCFD